MVLFRNYSNAFSPVPSVAYAESHVSLAGALWCRCSLKHTLFSFLTSIHSPALFTATVTNTKFFYPPVALPCGRQHQCCRVTNNAAFTAAPRPALDGTHCILHHLFSLLALILLPPITTQVLKHIHVWLLDDNQPHTLHSTAPLLRAADVNLNLSHTSLIGKSLTGNNITPLSSITANLRNYQTYVFPAML